VRAVYKVQPGETRCIGGNQWIVSRVEREAYLKDLAGVTKQMLLKPNPGKERESVVDLTVLKVAEASPMYAAGFRKDDRILKVNGIPIGTMGRAVNLVHEIKACDRLTVQVQRGDQIIDYQFDFE
jgi:S1-C subfamily serine protease